MFIKLILFFLLSQTLRSSSQILSYNGFNPPTDISLQGLATVTPNGLLKLTNTTVQKTGHAFYTKPIRFKDSPNATVSSFSTTFVFAIYSQIPTLSGHGIAFVISPSPALPSALPSQYIGLFNNSNNGNDTNHVFAVEFDTIQSNEFGDPNDNHVGIDINGLRSVKYSTAGYWNENNKFQNLNLISRKLMQVWINYDKLSNKIDVTMSPYGSDKPSKPLITYVTDLSSVLLQDMYVGFASATGSVISEHYIAGWSFRLNGEAPSLTSSNLPKLPRFEPRRISDFYKIGMPLISLFLIFSVISLAFYVARRRKKFEEELDDWETEFGKNRFRFKELYHATKGFKEKDLLGSGGFGRVYRGILPTTKIEVAVKRVSHDSKQDYEPKIVEIGYLRNMAADSLISSKEKILDLLNENTISREKGHEMIELRLQNEAKKLAFKKVKEKNKILLKNLDSIDDVNIREYVRSEQERIIRKMRQEKQQQSSSVTQNLFGKYFRDFGGSRANLPYY